MFEPAQSNALFTDLYQLTMAQAYHQSGQSGHATFSLYFRNFPPNRSFYVFCGLEAVLDSLEHLSFSDEDLEALHALDVFDTDFLDHLSTVRFTGAVRAMAEGEIFFPNEPVLEVTGPLIECQLAETLLVNLVNLESMLATKAARVVDAARGRPVFDFAARRTHGLDAAMKLARASYIAGFAGTSNVAAAARYGIPAVGTMAHSFISSFDSEREAFRSYARSFPDSSTFLVDTYDTIGGVREAIIVAQEMAANEHRLRAIRLDSGDLLALSRQARRLLDDAGFDFVSIVASGGLDEYAVDELVNSGAPIDAFGVGTRVGTSSDAPYTDFVYKLVEYDDRPVMKISEDKQTLPGPKQVHRMVNADGKFERDSITPQYQPIDAVESRPLLRSVMENGHRIVDLPDIETISQYHCEQIQNLPPELRGTNPTGTYRVEVSEELRRLAERVKSRLRPESDLS